MSCMIEESARDGSRAKARELKCELLVGSDLVRVIGDLSVVSQAECPSVYDIPSESDHPLDCTSPTSATFSANTAGDEVPNGDEHSGDTCTLA